MSDKRYVALLEISGKLGASAWTVKQGRPVNKKILDIIGEKESAEKGLICLESEYLSKIAESKKEDDDAIKKGEDARKKMIDSRNKKPEPKVEKDSKK